MSPSISLNVLLQCGLLLLCANCVRLENYENSFIDGRVRDLSRSFSWWPSIHNGVLRSRRQANSTGSVGATEGGKVVTNVQTPQLPVQLTNSTHGSEQSSSKDPKKVGTPAAEEVHQEDTVPKVSDNATDTITTVVSKATKTDEPLGNTTITDKSIGKDIDFNSPGVMKRGFIVFGGFSLLAVAYFIFYRRKNKNNDSGNSHSIADSNPFRYGVLQSDDKRDNLELSRVPLTMETDDDEDEDLEIFDLEQKKKSLSYVNLQMNDEDVVLNHPDSRENEIDNLLLDIEDGNSETLINWSSNGNKSIL